MRSSLPLAAVLSLAIPATAGAQPADLPIPAATTDRYPPGVSVARTKDGPVYVDAKGRTLYGMDLRTVLRWAPDPTLYCQDACMQNWQPLLAPAGARPNIRYPQNRPRGDDEKPAQSAAPAEEFVNPQRAPDWTVIEGPQGPQWVYKGWHMVFTRKGDKPRSAAFDGADNKVWNTLKFVPPVPKIEAPGGVTTIFADGAYALAAPDGRVLFTGKCGKDCGGWQPMAGGMANRSAGQWAVSTAGDTPQWTYKGKPVFISQEDDPSQPPANGTVLRP